MKYYIPIGRWGYTVLNVNTLHRWNKMSLFGIPDPWIWMSYVGCILCVGFCIVWAHLKDKEVESDE